MGSYVLSLSAGPVHVDVLLEYVVGVVAVMDATCSSTYRCREPTLVRGQDMAA